MMEGRCPDTFYCSNGTRAYSVIGTTLLIVPAYVALVSSSLSCLGAALILCAYYAFKDLRKGVTQTVVTLLALADLGTAVTGIFGASLFIGYGHVVQKSEKECYFFDTTCQIQGFMTMWSLDCGFIWTSILAVHLFLITAFNHSTWVNKLLPLYNIVAWMVPLTLTLPLLFLGNYGYNPDFQWTCLLRWHVHDEGVGEVLLWLTELLSTVVIFVGYTAILLYISCKQTCRLRRSAWRVNKRLLVILVAYSILRIPDTIQLTSLFIPYEACKDNQTQIFGFTKTTMEAATDTSQGWVNCVLYIFLSPEMRRRMFVLPFRKAVNRCKKQKTTCDQHLRTSEITPLLRNSPNTLSTQGRARERGETYISSITEFPETFNQH